VVVVSTTNTPKTLTRNQLVTAVEAALAGTAYSLDHPGAILQKTRTNLSLHFTYSFDIDAVVALLVAAGLNAHYTRYFIGTSAIMVERS
jgi:hypothetical protein